MPFQLYLHTATLLFFLSFNVFGMIHNFSAKIIDCWNRCGRCDILRLRAWVGVRKFLPTQLHSAKLRLQVKRSTPADCNPGFNSDSAALFAMFSDFTYSYPSFHCTLSHSPCIAQSHCIGDHFAAILIGLHIICTAFFFYFARRCTPS